MHVPAPPRRCGWTLKTLEPTRFTLECTSLRRCLHKSQTPCSPSATAPITKGLSRGRNAPPSKQSTARGPRGLYQQFMAHVAAPCTGVSTCAGTHAPATTSGTPLNPTMAQSCNRDKLGGYQVPSQNRSPGVTHHTLPSLPTVAEDRTVHSHHLLSPTHHAPTPQLAGTAAIAAAPPQASPTRQLLPSGDPTSHVLHHSAVPSSPHGRQQPVVVHHSPLSYHGPQLRAGVLEVSAAQQLLLYRALPAYQTHHPTATQPSAWRPVTPTCHPIPAAAAAAGPGCAHRWPRWNQKRLAKPSSRPR
jgi:hypothetical protein